MPFPLLTTPARSKRLPKPRRRSLLQLRSSLPCRGFPQAVWERQPVRFRTCKMNRRKWKRFQFGKLHMEADIPLPINGNPTVRTLPRQSLEIMAIGQPDRPVVDPRKLVNASPVRNFRDVRIRIVRQGSLAGSSLSDQTRKWNSREYQVLGQLLWHVVTTGRYKKRASDRRVGSIYALG